MFLYQMRTDFGLESLKGRDHSGDLLIDGRIMLKLILRKCGVNGLMWLRPVAVSGPLWTRY
jgi:hypothetical protein